MKKVINLFILVATFALMLNVSYAVRPTYTLVAKNFNYPAPNQMVFDIYISCTNTADTVLQFASGQYYFNFDSTYCNGGTITYDFAPSAAGDSSDFQFAARPRNPTRLLNTLRVNSNVALGNGNGPIVPAPLGKKIIRMRLSTSAAAFTSNNPEDCKMKWRNANALNPFTKIFAYVGNLNTEITDSLGHSILYSPTVVLVNPINNSINNPYTIEFKWRKRITASAYSLQVFSDSLLNNRIINDTIYNNTDTFKTVSGFLRGSTYYWKVGYKDTSLNFLYSSAYRFTTSFGLILNVKAIPEGLYYPAFNQLIRKDTFNIYIRSVLSPYAIMDSIKTKIDSLSFSSVFVFTHALQGVYYISIKHFNTIETWSKSGGVIMNLTDTTFYDFTSSVSQAYGNNLNHKGTKYCLYSGNVNQDNIIDAADISAIENDATQGLTGYASTDLNGDGIVDVSDLSIVDNNLGISVIQP